MRPPCPLDAAVCTQCFAAAHDLTSAACCLGRVGALRVSAAATRASRPACATSRHCMGKASLALVTSCSIPCCRLPPPHSRVSDDLQTRHPSGRQAVASCHKMPRRRRLGVRQTHARQTGGVLQPRLGSRLKEHESSGVGCGNNRHTSRTVVKVTGQLHLPRNAGAEGGCTRACTATGGRVAARPSCLRVQATPASPPSLHKRACGSDMQRAGSERVAAAAGGKGGRAGVAPGPTAQAVRSTMLRTARGSHGPWDAPGRGMGGPQQAANGCTTAGGHPPAD